MLSVFGGKITTYRKLAEHALEKLAPLFPAMTGAWTAPRRCPAATCRVPISSAFWQSSRRASVAAGAALRVTMPGSTARAPTACSTARVALAGLGQHFGGLLYEREIDYLRESRMGATAEDILDRRTKHGLHISRAQRAAVERHMGA